jgi:hypothetical protein
MSWILRCSAAALAIAMLPFFARAETAPPVSPATAPVAAPVAAPTTAGQTPPADPKPSVVTVSFSGWLVFNTYYNAGSFNTNAGFIDQPLYATPGDGGALGMSVKQTRLRANVSLPADGLLGNARLTGLVEGDFGGGYAAADLSQALPRLRLAWIAATWANLGGLTVRVGQDWGVLEGPVAAVSLGHITVPRFAGAGQVFRRSPQVRVEGELGDRVGGTYTGAVLPNGDKQVAADGVLVGLRSATPDFEGRVAVFYRTEKKKHVEIGISGHHAQERWILDGEANAPTKYLVSQAVAVDYKLDLPYVTILGSAFKGENLDVWNSGAGPGIRRIMLAPDNKKLLAVTGIRTKGLWSQLGVTPVNGLRLLFGGGVETPTLADLGADANFRRNQQLSAGAVVSAGGRWRAGLEVTGYRTRTFPGRLLTSRQVELSTLYSF